MMVNNIFFLSSLSGDLKKMCGQDSSGRWSPVRDQQNQARWFPTVFVAPLPHLRANSHSHSHSHSAPTLYSAALRLSTNQQTKPKPSPLNPGFSLRFTVRMATNSIRGLRRSPRLKKPPHSLPPRRGEKVPVQIPRRSFRLQNLSRKNRNENLRRSPRLKAAFFSEESRQCLEGLVKIGKISNVENLLKTGRFHGVQVTCFSEVRKVINYV